VSWALARGKSEATSSWKVTLLGKLRIASLRVTGSVLWAKVKLVRVMREKRRRVNGRTTPHFFRRV
jgi:hypothetical protein